MFKLFISLCFCFWSLVVSDLSFDDLNKVESWNIENTLASNVDDVDDNSPDTAALSYTLLLPFSFQSQQYQQFVATSFVFNVNTALIRAPPFAHI